MGAPEHYYKMVKDINTHFGRKLSYSSKSQHLSTMKKAKQENKHSSANNMVEYVIETTNNLQNLPQYELTEKDIHNEIIKWFNVAMVKYGNRHFATITSMEDVMTFFNRNWMMPRPLLNVNQLKLYDKRLDRYINEEKVNMATIHFLIFLILYTE